MNEKMPSRLTVAIDRRYLLTRRFFFNLKQKVLGKPRPGSYPYISGDSFRELADHIHDESTTFNPEDVALGDIVFVNNDLVLPYLQTIHTQIKNPYILISHNSDASIDKTIADLIDDKIVHYYAQDAVYAHEKIVPIPIGLENLHFYANGVTSFFDSWIKKITRDPPQRKNKAFFRFNIRTNPEERGPAQEYFSKHPLMETTTYKLSPILHAKKLMTYKFVASPPGHAIESCRTWEGLYLKTIPITKDFVATRYFQSLGLPIWIVKDWKELDSLTENDLAVKYDGFIKNASWEALRMDFWIKKIRHDQEKTRSSTK